MDIERLNPGPSPSDLVAEANHRFANNLASLAALVRRRTSCLSEGRGPIPRSQVTNTLADLHSAIIAIGRLHRALAAQPGSELVLNELLTSVLSDFKAVFGDRLLFEVSVAPECRLDAAQASIFLLAFSEIVANAMKHAHPTGLPVELTVEGEATPDGGVALHIADDGVGLPESSAASRPESMGFKLVHGLIESLEGRVDIRSSEIGLAFSIVLPAHGRAVDGHAGARLAGREATVIDLARARENPPGGRSG